MRYLLWTLVAVGGWNAVNVAAHMVFRTHLDRTYWYSILLGIWAAALLFLGS
jgi:hypothetical protein